MIITFLMQRYTSQSMMTNYNFQAIYEFEENTFNFQANTSLNLKYDDSVDLVPQYRVEFESR